MVIITTKFLTNATDPGNTMAQLGLLQEIMVCDLLSSDNLESVMRSDMYADMLLFDIVFLNILPNAIRQEKNLYIIRKK